MSIVRKNRDLSSVRTFINDEGQLLEMDLVRLRWHMDHDESPPDPEFVDQLDWLADQGWTEATPESIEFFYGTRTPKTVEMTELLSRLAEMVTKVESVPPECLSAEQAARFLGIGVPQLDHLVKTRKIRYVQVGDQRGRVFRISDLRAFVDARTVKTAEEELRRLSRR